MDASTSAQVNWYEYRYMNVTLTSPIASAMMNWNIEMHQTIPYFLLTFLFNGVWMHQQAHKSIGMNIDIWT